MPEYKIKISYGTGDSFENREEESYLELTWKNLDVAKENLVRIKEHYEMYKGYNAHHSKKLPDIWLRDSRYKEWYVDKGPDRVHYATQCIYLKTDDGNNMQMSCFWCGYFESLISAEIELDNSDMKISF